MTFSRAAPLGPAPLESSGGVAVGVSRAIPSSPLELDMGEAFQGRLAGRVLNMGGMRVAAFS
eukprot:8311690-Pyramimonas_sp.AAC.1